MVPCHGDGDDLAAVAQAKENPDFWKYSHAGSPSVDSLAMFPTSSTPTS